MCFAIRSQHPSGAGCGTRLESGMTKFKLYSVHTIRPKTAALSSGGSAPTGSKSTLAQLRSSRRTPRFSRRACLKNRSPMPRGSSHGTSRSMRFKGSPCSYMSAGLRAQGLPTTTWIPTGAQSQCPNTSTCGKSSRPATPRVHPRGPKNLLLHTHKEKEQKPQL